MENGNFDIGNNVDFSPVEYGEEPVDTYFKVSECQLNEPYGEEAAHLLSSVGDREYLYIPWDLINEFSLIQIGNNKRFKRLGIQVSYNIDQDFGYPAHLHGADPEEDFFFHGFSKLVMPDSGAYRHQAFITDGF